MVKPLDDEHSRLVLFYDSKTTPNRYSSSGFLGISYKTEKRNINLVADGLDVTRLLLAKWLKPRFGWLESAKPEL